VSDPDQELSDLVSDLRYAGSEDEEAALGRDRLASLLLHHGPQVLDDVLKLARRDNRMRRCLSAARYYSGLSAATCDKIDAVLRAPFPAAARPKARSRKR
jgi:hypothetical protein